ncbi:hypothetical protein C5L31_002131 [Secundilactobacillus malefermentans]|uniref:DUF5640 domain-containing protein n=1 Tax=Secundilactobacillus malefermentans TaxID=176292 RepID=A0A4R5NRZ8_9LACO|nr:hypothetical protein [Secundilactobacillus malefermentans]TDG79912.1 hypothetical protein C5L31_002131 [Secundilactobacillus malefermentans]
MKKFYWLMMVIAMVLGIGMMPSNASATSTTKHVTVPASMRGTWTTHRDKKKNSTSFKMTKYSIYITDYHKGIKTNRLWLHGSTFKKGSKAIPFQLRKQTPKISFTVIGS